MRLFQFLFLTLSFSVLFSCQSEKDYTTIYLVRHAEKDTTVDQYNPPLIEEGYERAVNLKKELSSENIKYIYSTKFDRTINTVQPISEVQNTEIHIYEYHKWQSLLDSLKSISGTHLISGHSDNLLPMIEYLGADVGKERIGHLEYDNLFKVTIQEGSVSGEVLKF